MLPAKKIKKMAKSNKTTKMPAVLPDHRQSKLDENKVREAVTALVAFHKKRTQELKNELFLNEAGVIQLQLAVWKITGEKAKTIKIELPHSPHPKTIEACLFTKDEKGKSSEESADYFNQLLQENDVKGVSEVIPLKLYRTEYKPYIARRQLAHKYDVFLADDRIFRLLHTHLGKEFYKRKKYPVCVNLKKIELKKEIEGAIHASYFILSNRGDCNHFAVGRTDMTVDQITENIMAGVRCMVQHITKGWPNVKALYLKTKRSISLPIYSSLMYENWADDLVVDNKDLVKLRKQVQTDTTSDDNDDESDDDDESPKKIKRGRDRKREKSGKKPELPEKPVAEKKENQPQKEKKKKPKRRASGKMLKKIKEKRAQEAASKGKSLEKDPGRTISKDLLAEKSKIKAKKGKKPPVVSNPKVAKFTSKSKMDVKTKMAARSKINPKLAAKHKMDVKTMSTQAGKVGPETANKKKVKRGIKKEAEAANQNIKKEKNSPKFKRETKPTVPKTEINAKSEVKQEIKSAVRSKPLKGHVKVNKPKTGGLKNRKRSAKV